MSDFDVENPMTLGHGSDPYFDRPPILGNCAYCHELIYEGDEHEEDIDREGNTIYFCDEGCEEEWRNEQDEKRRGT